MQSEQGALGKAAEDGAGRVLERYSADGAGKGY